MLLTSPSDLAQKEFYQLSLPLGGFLRLALLYAGCSFKAPELLGQLWARDPEHDEVGRPALVSCTLI